MSFYRLAWKKPTKSQKRSRTYKDKKHKEEQKNIMMKMNNLVDGLNSRREWSEKRVNELEDRIIDSIQYE